LDPTMMRQTGDIDILVQRESLTEAAESVLRIPGYVYRELSAAADEAGWLASYHPSLTDVTKARIRRKALHNYEFQLVNRKRAALVELHVRLFAAPSRGRDRIWGAPSSDALVARIWNHRRRQPELGCDIPCSEHSLLISCLHAALKRSPANNCFRLGILVDIDVLISSGIRWDAFVRDCIDLRLAPFAYFSLRLTRRLIETPVPGAVLSELKASCSRLQLALTRLHLRCLGSLESSDRLYSILCRALSPWALQGPWKDRIQGALLMHLWLPPRTRMASLLGVSVRSPLLLFSYVLNPMRWMALIVVRIFRTSWPGRRFQSGS